MAATNVQVFSGDVEVANAGVPTDFTGITYQSADVKAVITNDNLSGTNGSMIQVYRSVLNRTPSAIDFHSEEKFNASNVYTLCLNPRGGRIGLNDLNPNSDLTMGARIYNTKGYVGLTGDDSDPIVYKGDTNNTTVTLPYNQLSTSNPTSGPAYYFINPYPGEAQCTVVYDNAQSSANGLVYFYCVGTNHQPATNLANSPLGNSEFTIPLLETGTLRGRRVSAVHVKPINGAQVRIVAVYWVPFRGVTANIKDGGKLVLGTVGNFGTPEAGLTFRREYETPTGNVLEPTQRLDNGIAWMTDLSTWYNGALGGNGINWSKNNGTYGVSVGARIWYQPGSFISAGGGAGNCGSLYLSAGHSTAASNTPDIAIKSNGNVGIGTTAPSARLQVGGNTETAPQYLWIRGNRVNEAGDISGIHFYNSLNSGDRGNSRIINSRGTDNYASTLQFWTNPAGNVPATQKMVIDQNGNVGIGTASPITKLDLFGGSLQTSFNQYIGCALSDNFAYDGSIMPHYGIQWRTHSAYTGASSMHLSGHQGFRFFTEGSEKFTIIPNGSVGIGTAAPSHKLHINGNGYASGGFFNHNQSFYFGPDVTTTVYTTLNGAQGWIYVMGSGYIYGAARYSYKAGWSGFYFHSLVTDGLTTWTNNGQNIWVRHNRAGGKQIVARGIHMGGY